MKGKDVGGANHPILAACGWIAKDADQRRRRGILMAPQTAAIRPMSDHGSQLRSRCWFYRGGKTGEPGEKPSKHDRDQLQQLYSHESMVKNQDGWSSINPAITPCDRVNLELSGERERANRIRHPSLPSSVYTVRLNRLDESQCLNVPFLWLRVQLY